MTGPTIVSPEDAGIGRARAHVLAHYQLAQRTCDLDAVLKSAGLAFEVEKEALYVQREGKAGTKYDGEVLNVALPSHFAITRTDTQQVLGVVGDRYTPLQNRDAFAPLVPLCEGGLASFIGAGAFGGGRRVWAQVAFHLPEQTLDVLTDGGRTPIRPYGIVTNNHDGKGQVHVGETPIVVVCENTLAAAKKGLKHDAATQTGTAISVPHLGNVATAAVDAATQVWGQIISRYEKVAEQYRRLRAATMTDKQFETVVLNTVLPLPTGDSKRSGTARDKVQVRRDLLVKYFHESPGAAGRTAWDAFMGVTFATDHGEGVFPLRKAELAEAVTFGTLRDVKTDAIDALLAFASR